MSETSNVPMIMGDTLTPNVSSAPVSVDNTTGTAVGAPQRPQYVVPPKTKTIIRKYDKKIGRNDPCPCGSGKKYKKCCLNTGRYEETYELTGVQMRQVKDHDKKPSDFKEKLPI